MLAIWRCFKAAGFLAFIGREVDPAFVKTFHDHVMVFWPQDFDRIGDIFRCFVQWDFRCKFRVEIDLKI